MACSTSHCTAPPQLTRVCIGAACAGTPATTITQGTDDADGNYIPVVGEPLGTFVIGEQVGRGAFGRVFADVGGNHVIKITNRKKAYTVNAAREVKILEYLFEKGGAQHNIITIITSIFYRGHACIVFPRMRCTLYDCLYATGRDARGIFNGLALEAVTAIARQLLAALVFLAEVGIVHRDIKPENILVDGSGNVKLADFGSSVSTSSPGGDEGYLRYFVSRYYRPPEIIVRAQLPYAPSIDIWGLACVLYEMVAGEPLFVADNEHATLCKIFRMCDSLPQNIICTANQKDSFFVYQAGAWLLKSSQSSIASRALPVTVQKTCGLRDDLLAIAARREGRNGESPWDYLQFHTRLKLLLHVHPTKRISAKEAQRVWAQR